MSQTSGQAFQQALATAPGHSVGALQALAQTAPTALAKVQQWLTQAKAVGQLGVSGLVLVGGGLLGAGAYAQLERMEQIRQTYQGLRQRFSETQNAASPCLPCLDQESGPVRQARWEKRQNLLQKAQKHPDPEQQATVKRLQQDMGAVEMARLSDNTYAQFDPNCGKEAKTPPAPWQAMGAAEAQAHGIDPEWLQQAKGVIYRLPETHPFEPKVVLAFRGTTSERTDIVTDHDQALGLNTVQYQAACALGKAMQKAFPHAHVTGHSLGGGKAQAAGVSGGLQGTMFNAAGLHPKTVGLTPETLGAHQARFAQYRAEGGPGQWGDPLTGLQNQPALQAALYQGLQGVQAWAKKQEQAWKTLDGGDPLGRLLPPDQRALAQELWERVLHVTPQEAARNHAYSGGRWHLPPAIGEVRGVVSKTPEGHDARLLQQHGLGPLIHGLETRKAQDIHALLRRTGEPGPLSDYLGPAHSPGEA